MLKEADTGIELYVAWRSGSFTTVGGMGLQNSDEDLNDMRFS